MEALQRLHNRGSISTGYDIEYSSVWEPDLLDQAYLLQGSTAGTRTKQTFSVWIKRTELGGDQYIFEGGTGNANDTQFGIQFSNSNKLQIMRGHTSGGYQYLLNTNRIFRDTYAWYHIVVAIDTTLSTADNRVRLYVNGVEETSFANRNNPSQNDNLGTFAANSQISLGVSANLGKYIAAYIAHPALVYNAQLPPTDFGEFDSDTGIWKPKDLSAIDFGTYGYWLKNETSNQMYNDSSGNSRNFGRWDSTIYQSTDTPTNNFCTFNTLQLNTTSGTNPAFTDGATGVKRTTGAGWMIYISTIAVNKGKWYAEFELERTNALQMQGTLPVSYAEENTTTEVYLGSQSDGSAGVGWYGSGSTVYHGGGYSSSTAADGGDIIGVAVDCDNNKVHFRVNATWTNSSNPSSGNSGGFAINDELTYIVLCSQPASRTYKANFGGLTRISISSAATDANGYGTFEHEPPTGYYALCSKNLEEYG